MIDTQAASLRDIARRLLDLEAASLCASQQHEAVRVCERLQVSLTRFAGADGFTSLLRRALALARVEIPSIQNIRVKADGSIEGLEAIAADSRDSGKSTDAGTEAAIAITTNLLALLVTFVGKRITLRLVREAWPGALLDESHERSEAP